MFIGSKASKNTARLLSICEELIDKYEVKSKRQCPSCKSVLLNETKTRLRATRDEVATWKDSETDYIEYAHAVLSNIAFDLAASGKFHLSYGVLSPMSCAYKLLTVYKCCIDWFYDKSLIDQDERDARIEALHQQISQVG